ncbi:SGNH/GDSL hydrolase family protein [Spiroplasma chrysopicola]|uniref:Lipolytic enzyme, GDSL family n=1 Tax=Spiroplasma chrysopicola DF-1 TaxID=1276227 RepID=R4UCD4_9MOLU|nr:SGNH/GDSL hydrolase family protein [Spiroplasma chrysopicola]AGM25554.1 lipolytic enzyme, GDSL family [Spiroplasma chrysopicola DF-1]
MKKLLSVLGAMVVTTSTATSIISCSIPQGEGIDLNKDLQLIGTNLDKTKAIDDRIAGNFFSNYYILGDSLSDSHGIENVIYEKTNLPVKMTGNYENGSFTNGETAGVLLGDKLGFGSAIRNSDVQYFNNYSNPRRNYAVGGATAAKMQGAMGMIINNVSIEEQAKYLVQQHQLFSDELIFIEIGGNDMMAMLNDNVSNVEQNKLLDEMLVNLRNTFFTLTNNGARHILFMNTPDVQYIPRYNAIYKPELPTNEREKELELVHDKANLLGEKINYETKKLIDTVNQYYPNSIKMYDLFSNTKSLLDTFANDLTTKYNITDPVTILDESDLIEKIFSGGELESQLAPSMTTEDFNNHFFFDDVHPTANVHRYMSEELAKLVKEWE